MGPTLSRRTLLAALLTAPAVARAEPRWRVPIAFHIADEGGAPVAPDAFVATLLEYARRIFEPLGIALVDAGHRKLVGKPARLTTRAQRDALAPAIARGVINCFVVAQLMDVDEPGRERNGVHWHARAARQRHYVIVSRIAKPWVLAHELGHFLGNPEHSDTAGNLMSYQWTLEVPFLDDLQTQRVHETLAKLFARGELRAP